MARRWRCGAGGHSATSTGPESTVPSAARTLGGAGLRPEPPGVARSVNAVRVFFIGGYLAYRALFAWIH